MVGIRRHILYGKEKLAKATSGKEVIYYENAGRASIVVGYIESHADFDSRGNPFIDVSSIGTETAEERLDRVSMEKLLGRCSFW